LQSLPKPRQPAAYPPLPPHAAKPAKPAKPNDVPRAESATLGHLAESTLQEQAKKTRAPKPAPPPLTH
jgi:hypothetical protein